MCASKTENTDTNHLIAETCLSHDRADRADAGGCEKLELIAARVNQPRDGGDREVSCSIDVF